MHDHAPPTAPDDLSPSEATSHPLIRRLVQDFGYPVLEQGHDLAEYLGRPGTHCLFIPGDPRRNLETADAAVILPELRQAFQGAFDCAVVGDAIEARVREETRALKTPALVFLRDGRPLGTIEKVRDWSDYLARITHILAAKAA